MTMTQQHNIQDAVADCQLFRNWMSSTGTPRHIKDIYGWPHVYTARGEIEAKLADDSKGVIVTVPPRELSAFLCYFNHNERTRRIDDRSFYLPFAACIVMTDTCSLLR